MSEQIKRPHEVLQDDVPTDQRELAARCLSVAARELNLPGPITTRWFVVIDGIPSGETGERQIWWFAGRNPGGYVCDDKPHELWIQVGLDIATLIGVVAHECWHLWQLQTQGRPLAAGVREEREVDAYAYEQSFRARWLAAD